MSELPIHNGEQYQVFVDRQGGFRLVRRSDGASTGFQPGKEADRFWDEFRRARSQGQAEDHLAGYDPDLTAQAS